MRDLAHFGYTQVVGTSTTTASTPEVSVATGSTNGNSLLLLVTGTGGTLREAGLVVTQAINGSVPVVTVKVRPVPNSASNERTVDTISLTSSNIAGDVVRNNKLGANVAVNPGEEIEIELTTKGDGANGKVVPYVIFEPAYIGNLEVGKSISKPYSDVANAVGKIYNVQA
jgi:hypothetical protein